MDLAGMIHGDENWAKLQNELKAELSETNLASEKNTLERLIGIHANVEEKPE